MKLYDKENNRLVILEQKSTSEFWDKHWDEGNFIEKVKRGKNNRLVKKFTIKFLKSGTKILEGGCGIGQNVYGLSQWGYNAYGVDFAENTVKKISKEFPKLKVSVQDVRNLNFPDNFFDGYWSLGVIEHFWDGYSKILEEMKRVLKPRSYLFLTFPYLSPLRKLKIQLGFYEKIKEGIKTDNFYEFILDEERVKNNVEKYGFKLKLKYPFDATKGIKDEISLLNPFLQKIYNSQNILSKGVRFLNSLLFSRIAGHVILLIFQKDER